MGHFKTTLLLFASIFSIAFCASSDTINSAIVNKRVQRNVDLSSHLPKITTSITLENTGTSAVKSFLFAVEPALKDHLSYIGAVVRFKNMFNVYYKYNSRITS